MSTLRILLLDSIMVRLLSTKAHPPTRPAHHSLLLLKRRAIGMGSGLFKSESLPRRRLLLPRILRYANEPIKEDGPENVEDDVHLFPR